MTNDELKRELDALGVEYKAKATHDELEALLAPYLNDENTDKLNDEDAPEGAEDKADAPGDEDAEQANDDEAKDCEGSEESGEPDVLVVTAPRVNVRYQPDGDVFTILTEGTEVLSDGDAEEHEGTLWQPVKVDDTPLYIRADLVAKK